uniref:Zinc finger PHD-type domain-containing protein n=1 Tax=Globisporangium ultimum (strain ATCC 200006 / CBS 805.95 / DAOM BR144) TaxID=431595 RepID=K3WGG2_GLOUD
MARAAATFSEVVALLQRNALEERDARDVEQDLRRLLLMARDARHRDEMVQFQAVRRVTSIWTASSAITTYRYCAGILGNLAQCERGRLSASSCDRWGCVSHRHHCPLFVLLHNAQCSPDAELQRIAAAAMLAFSVQNECQLQLDAVSGIPVLLRLLDYNDADVRVYAAATMWNMCKSPLLMLKLETIHGILKDRLARRLTDILTTPLEPFHLNVKPTGERGITGIIESDSPENLNLLLSSSINTQLSIVLHVENCTGHPRSLTDQFSAKTSGKPNRAAKSNSKSVAHFDDRGVLASRTCAVCTKAIKVNRKSARGTFLLCAKDECGQTYHIKCSRWATLDEDDIHPEHFHCDTCMTLLPLYYWDFVAENEKHSELLSENLFKSVAITRVSAAHSTSWRHQQ